MAKRSHDVSHCISIDKCKTYARAEQYQREVPSANVERRDHDHSTNQSDSDGANNV